MSKLKINFKNSCPSFKNKIDKVFLNKIETNLEFYLKKHHPKFKKNSFLIELNLIGDQKMKRINLEFRNKNKTTDVLSFPMFESLRSGLDLMMIPQIEEEILLGDILISKNVCLKQALEHNLKFKEEFEFLFNHGFLHLLGFDHEKSKEEEVLMQKHEDILNKI